MTRAVTTVVVAIAGLVGLWALAGFVASMAYRRNQIADHACLAHLPTPVGLVHVGVVALLVMGVCAVVMVRASAARGRRHAMVALAIYSVLLIPLLATSIVISATVPRPPHQAWTACMSDDEGLT